MVLSKEEVDRALDQAQRDSERVAESLVAMDAHPGHRLLRDSALTGLTEQRWAEASTAMAALWDQFGRFRDLVARAQEVRARRSKPGEEELAELTEILRGPIVELDARAIPIDQRGLTGPSQVIERITLADLMTRMRTAFDTVTAVLAAAEAAWSAAIGRLDPLDRRLHEVSVLAESIGAGADEVSALRQELARTRELVLTDVLTAQATDALPDVEARIAALANRLAGLAKIKDQFAGRLASLENLLSDVEAAEATARQAFAAVDEKIAAHGLPTPDTRGSTAVRSRLQRLTARQDTASWAAIAKEADELDRFAGQTLAAARMSLRAITGLLDRRAELRGRLEAYQVKAARLGHAEDDELSGLHDAAQKLLFTAPCDLPAATRALNRYRQAIQERSPSREETTS